MLCQTIFSTGLFALLPTNVTNNIPLLTTSRFDSTLYNSTHLSSAPVYAYYGVLSQNFPQDAGVTNELAYSTFRAASDVFPDSVLSGEVEALIPQPNCLAVDVTLTGPGTTTESGATSKFDDLSVQIPPGYGCDRWKTINVAAQDPEHFVLPKRQLAGTFQPAYCSDSGKPAQPAGYLYALSDIEYQQRLFKNASQLEGGNAVIASDTSRTVSKLVSVLCRPTYTYTRVLVSNATSNATLSVSRLHLAQNETLDGLTAQNLNAAFSGALSSASSLFGTTSGAVSASEEVPDTLFSLMALSQNSSTYNVLLDAEKLRSAAETTYQGIASQYARRSLTVATNDRTKGTSSHSELRLQMVPVALWVMVAGFALLIPLSLVIMLLGPGAATPRDPRSIGSNAAILARSNDLQWLLREQGSSTPSRLKVALSGHQIQSTVLAGDRQQPNFKIGIESPNRDSNHIESAIPIRSKNWRPAGFNVMIVTSSIVFPIGAIVVLSLLQSRSDQNNGIASASDNSTTIAYTHFIPAVIVLLLATLYNIIEFGVSLLAPHSSLASGNASARRTLSLVLLGKLPPHAFLAALSTRHVAPALSILAATSASVLTILVSGLYTVQNFNSISSTSRSAFDSATTTTSPTDTFYPAWQNSVSNDTGAAALLSLLEHNPSQPYPNFVYDTFALQTTTLETSGQNKLSPAASTANAILPALRGTLTCNVIPESDLSTLYLPGKSPLSAYEDDMVFVFSTVHLPASCHLAGPFGNESSFEFMTGFPLQRGPQGTYAGKVTDLVFGNGSSIYGNFGEDYSAYVDDSPAVGCPSLGFTLAHFIENGTDVTSQELTSAVCWQGLESVNVNATLAVQPSTRSIRGITIARTTSNSGVEVVPNPEATDAAGSKTFDWRIERNFDTEMEPFTESQTVDNFFQALLYGRDSIDPSSLLGPSNQGTLIQHIQSLYQRYIALVLNGVMRQPCPQEQRCPINTINRTNQDASSKRQDSRTSNSRPVQIATSSTRIIQNSSTKLAMQVLLGVTTGLTAIVLILTWNLWRPGSGVVPHNICTIAGVMALLAGSELCQSESLGICECCGRPRQAADADEMVDHQPKRVILPEGAEWSSDSELQHLLDSVDGAGRRMKYSLGWWKDRPEVGRTRRFGIDTGVRADGSDDQDWEIGRRGGVKGKGLGWGDFMMRNLSLGSLHKARVASWGSFVGTQPPQEMYMAGAMPGQQQPIYDADDHEMEYVPATQHQEQQPPPPARFASLRGYGYGPGYAYSRANGRDADYYDTSYHGHSRGLSRLSEEEDELDDAYDANLLRPPAGAAVHGGPAVGGAGRRVRWNERDEVRHYHPRNSYDGDAASSLYSGDGYGHGVEEGRKEGGAGAVRQGGSNDMDGFDFGFGFGKGEA